MPNDRARGSDQAAAWFMFCDIPSVDPSWLDHIQSRGASNIDKALAAKKWLKNFTPPSQYAPSAWITSRDEVLMPLLEFVGFCTCAANPQMMQSAVKSRELVRSVNPGTYARFQESDEVRRGRRCTLPLISTDDTADPSRIGIGMAIAISNYWGDGVAERLRLRLPRTMQEKQITSSEAQVIEWNDWIEGLHNEFCDD